MYWGIGTGRCGTAGLAIQLGGVHEMRGSVEELAKEGHRAVVDPALWRVIPSIYEEDPEARFVWIYRDPVEVVESWLGLGLFRKELNPVPFAWRAEPPRWPEGWGPHMKGAWLWRTINSRIREMVLDGFEVRHVSELQTHVNKTVPGKETFGVIQEKVSLTTLERMEVWEWCDHLYAELVRLSQQTKGRTGAWGTVTEVPSEMVMKDWREEEWGHAE